MLITWVRLFHTLVFVVMFGAILFLLYCGLTNRLTIWTAIAFGLISIEVVIYATNSFRCPLRTWAEDLTPAGQTIQDIYLPPWLSARVVAISTPLLGVACLLLLGRLLAR
ncbi:hypothetical protein IQ273_18210 [Nodosilinea sp. LEGE 07298]|uniref:hypothetical protein n=1 Tax=Nodosilinea sp. LEGE 07298 TaxID=2777970 RepID=UPI0018829FC2|nr:hypothetical protein [Nodosilinea sp. LEGE 07298]MBE9111343.1 hypothetical protein [Nodosilinea sp. LEGE 07298]